MIVENHAINYNIIAISHSEAYNQFNPAKTQPLSLPKVMLFLDREGQTCNLAEEVGQIERNYYALRHFLITPAVIQYEELVQLRHCAGNAEMRGDWRGQLRLAVALLRLGRRAEVIQLTQIIERSMPLNSQENAVYRLWLALVCAVSSDCNRAAAVARQLLLHLDEQQGRQMVNFFNMVNRHAGSSNRNAIVLGTVEAGLSA